MKTFERFVENLGRGVLVVIAGGLYLAALGYVGFQFIAALFSGSLLWIVLFGAAIAALVVVLVLVLTS